MSLDTLKSSNHYNIWRQQKQNCNIIIESFINYDKILIHHKNIPDISLTFPLNLSLYFDVMNIEDELNRFQTIYNYNKFINNKKYTSKRLIIYNDDNPSLIALIDFIISKNKYKSYHIFCNSNKSYNAFKYIEKKYSNKVRLNDIENNFLSMIRIQFNEYEDYYNDDEICNDDIIIFLNNESEFYYLDDIFKTIHNCYISLPYNRFILYLLYLKYGQYYDIELINSKNNYMLIKISYNNKKTYTLAPIIDKIENWCNKYTKYFIQFINDSLI